MTGCGCGVGVAVGEGRGCSIRTPWRSILTPTGTPSIAPLTLEKGKAWHIARELDAEAMHRAAQALVGRHDFTTFRSAHCQAKDPVKTLDRLDVRREGDHVIIEAAARSFLHHQVRSMVGTLALVGLGQWSESQVAEALAAKDRAALGLNAPAEGLYFVAARYPEA